MDLFESVYLPLANLKDSVINKLCDMGLIQDPQRLTLNGASALFRVTSASERWRVQDAMGEKPVLERFIAEVSPDDCVWDIGAAVGTYSCLAADLGATVVAFEPHPVNRQRCIENLELNNADATVLDVALSDRTGQTTMAEDTRTGSGKHQLSEDGNLQVDTLRGDDVNAPPPDVIKIDVEGHEVAVLDGLSERLHSTRTVFVECHAYDEETETHVRERLHSAGFNIKKISMNRPLEVFLVAERRP